MCLDLKKGSRILRLLYILENVNAIILESNFEK